MPLKVAAFILTLICNVIAGVVILFMMLIGMNGYSESDAQWGLAAFVILSIVISILMGIAAVFLFKTMVRKQFSTLIAVLTAVPALSAVGVVLELISSLIGIGIAEFVRVNY